MFLGDLSGNDVYGLGLGMFPHDHDTSPWIEPSRGKCLSRLVLRMKSCSLACFEQVFRIDIGNGKVLGDPSSIFLCKIDIEIFGPQHHAMMIFFGHLDHYLISE